MKGKTAWQEVPHRIPFEDYETPEIVRLAPVETEIEIQFVSPESGVFSVEYRPAFAKDTWTKTETNEKKLTLSGLTPYCDYQVRIASPSGKKSKIRLFRTSPVPGKVINYLHQRDQRYSFSGRALCSPSIVKLPSGAIVCSMDVYEGMKPQNLSFVFRSEDGGETWEYLCDLFPLFWGNLFFHKGRLYMMGCSTEFGDVVIGASDDEGRTWTTPVHLFAGSSTVGSGWQQAPMPVLRHNGYLRFAMEYAGRGVDTGVTVLSVHEDADLLDPANWCATKPVAFDKRWPGAPEGEIYSLAEGSLIVDPEGKIKCILRINIDGHDSADGWACVLSVDENDRDAPMEFSEFIRMPTGLRSKTFILYDEVSKRYIAVGNACPNGGGHARHVLTLSSSADARIWQANCHLIDYRNAPASEVGFQYPYFFIDGDDLVMQVRTAINGANNYHDANYSTFHRIPSFRALLNQKAE